MGCLMNHKMGLQRALLVWIYAVKRFKILDGYFPGRHGRRFLTYICDRRGLRCLTALSDGDHVPSHHLKCIRSGNDEGYSHQMWSFSVGMNDQLFFRRGERGHCHCFCYVLYHYVLHWMSKSYPN